MRPRAHARAARPRQRARLRASTIREGHSSPWFRGVLNPHRLPPRAIRSRTCECADIVERLEAVDEVAQLTGQSSMQGTDARKQSAALASKSRQTWVDLDRAAVDAGRASSRRPSRCGPGPADIAAPRRSTNGSTRRASARCPRDGQRFVEVAQSAQRRRARRDRERNTERVDDGLGAARRGVHTASCLPVPPTRSAARSGVDVTRRQGQRRWRCG